MSNYWKYLIQKQKTLLVIYTAICFVLFLFPILFSFTQGSDTFTLIENAHQQVGFLLQKLAIVLVPLMIVLPIFNYRFMLNKKMVDVYLTLPIKRKTLFASHYVISLLMAILPPVVMSIISFITLMIYSHDGIAVILFWAKWEILVISVGVALYAVITFVMMKTNNIIDAAIMSASYLIVPLIAISAIDTFVRSQTFLYDLPIFDWIDQISYFLSPILLLIKIVGNFIQNYSIMIEHWIYFGYCLGLFMLFTWMAQKEFENKKGEDAEQITTHWCTYPLISNVLSVCLISFIGFSSDITITIVLFTIIFVIYAIINFIASKSVRFTPQLFVKFFLLIGLFAGLSWLSRETEFFGMNRHLVNLDHVSSIEVRTSTYDENTGEWQEYYLYISDIEKQKELVDQLQQFQLKASKKFKNKNEELYTNSSINVSYEMKNGSKNIRDYTCFTNQELKPIIVESQNLEDENFKWE